MYSLFYYLRKLLDGNKLSFPFAVLKSESPDFILISADGKKIGLEIAEITTEEYQRYLTEQSVKESVDVKILLDMPYVGDSVEQEWSELAKNIILQKLNKLNSIFSTYAENRLVLYSNTHLPNIYYDVAQKMLSQKMNDTLLNSDISKGFDTINIIYGENVLLDFLVERKEN